jgi:hypothetical protein
MDYLFSILDILNKGIFSLKGWKYKLVIVYLKIEVFMKKIYGGKN